MRAFGTSRRLATLRTAGLLAAAVAALLAAQPVAASSAFIDTLSTVDLPGTSTVPANGDINPYGVAVVPRTVGRLVRGNILVSNFNAKTNLQGTGTTIVELTPGGSRRVFAKITPAILIIRPNFSLPGCTRY